MTIEDDTRVLWSRSSCGYEGDEMGFKWAWKEDADGQNVSLPSVVTGASVLSTTGSKTVVGTDQNQWEKPNRFLWVHEMSENSFSQ